MKASVAIVSLLLIFVIGFVSSQNVYSEKPTASIDRAQYSVLESLWEYNDVYIITVELYSDSIKTISGSKETMIASTTGYASKTPPPGEQEPGTTTESTKSEPETTTESEPETTTESEPETTTESEPETTTSTNPTTSTSTTSTSTTSTATNPTSTTSTATNPTSTQKTTTELPDWIKNSAKGWSSGALNDMDFSKVIVYMIKDEIIRIPQVQTEKEMSSFSVENIPNWIKNSAKWWSEGLLSDEDFTKGLEYLVKKEIIKV